MRTWTSTDRRLGIWSAVAIVLISLAYIATGATWLISSSTLARARGLQPSEPYLAILEILILISTPAIVVLFSAMHAYAPADRKTLSLAAFGFALLLSGMTGAIHFLQLTVIRLTTSQAITEIFALYDPGGRLTPILATDLVAWNFFFGFALLCGAAIFRGDKLQNTIRGGMILSGALCLLGTAGPGSGNLRLQYPAIVGYAFIFPIISLLVGILFIREKPEGARASPREEVESVK